MDNLTHTLTGLALADAGLKRTTRFGTAVLVVGANLPDLDGLMYVVGTSTDALAFRRGWTHGVIAMIALPLLLAAAALGWSRLVTRRSAGRPAVPVDPGWLLALAAIAIWSHPLLDLLNTYGVRLLMPFSGRWFYGDVLFIVDPWIWATLTLGVLLSRRRVRSAAPGEGRPARIAIGVAAAYALVMAISSRAGSAYVNRVSTTAALRIMAAPRPGTPFRREIIRDLGGRYEFGELALPRPAYSPGYVEPVGRDAPGVSAASATRAGSQFLRWARFPQFVTQRRGDSIRVTMSDARYAQPGSASWASLTVTVPASRAGTPGTTGGRQASRMAW